MHWLGVGAVGIGLAAAIASGQGVASAATDDSSKSSDPGPSASDAKSDSGASDKAAADGSSADSGDDTDDTDKDADDTDDNDTDATDADDTDADDDGQLKTNRGNHDRFGSRRPAADATDDDTPADSESEPNPDQTDADAETDPDQTDPPSTEPDTEVEDVGDAKQAVAKDRSRDRQDADAAPTQESSAPTQAAPSDEPEATSDVQNNSAPAVLTAVVNNILTGLGLNTSEDGTQPTSPLGGLAESLLLVAASGESDREEALADFNRTSGWIPVLGTVLNAISLVRNLGELGSAALRGDGADVGDEIGDLTRDFIGLTPVVGAPIAAGLYDLMTPTQDVSGLSGAAPDAEPTLNLFQQVLFQLTGATPPAETDFVTVANYALDQALDAHDDFIDLLVANPTPATQWMSDLSALVDFVFVAAVPIFNFVNTLSAESVAWLEDVGEFMNGALPLYGAASRWVDNITNFANIFYPPYSFSDRLNQFAGFLNGFVPPYKMEDSVSGTISEAQVAAAAVGALVKVLDTLLANDFDIEHLRDAAIEGGTAGFLAPSSVLDMTFTAGAEPNAFSIAAYIALVAVYKRFQEVALNHLPVVTEMTQGGQLALSTTGQVIAEDEDGDPLTYSVASQAAHGLVTVGADGSWLYTRTSDWSETDTDTFTMTIDDSLGQVGDLGLTHPYSPDGHSITVTVTVNYTATANNDPTSAVLVNLPDSMGIVRGTVTGIDIDGDTLTYRLVNPGTTGATDDSIYTTEGGIVQLDTATGEFVYIPKVSTDLIPALDSDTFDVQVSDGRGGTSTSTVVVLSDLTPTTSTTSTSAYVENGKVDIPTADGGLLTYSLGSGPSKGSVVVNADGTYTYTRSVSATGDTDDSFTIVGTDVNGKMVTLPTVSVSPPLVDITPSTTVSGETFIPRGMLNGTAITPATQTTTGTFSGTDAVGDPVTISGGTYTSALGGVVTVLSNGSFVYTNVTYTDAFHRAGADDASAADKVDTVKIDVTDSFGGITEVTFTVQLQTENSDPSSDTSVGSADALGVVRGSVTGSDNDGDSLTYSLAGAGNPSGATTGSTYTANGGIVSLNSDGTFTYIPNKSASATDSFAVLVADGHGGTTTATVNVPLTTPSPVTNVNTSLPNWVTGQLNVPTADSGLMTYSLGAGPSKGTVTVNSDGTFTYGRTTALGHSTSPTDSFDIIGTEVATGKTVTIATITVTPVVANNAPVTTGVTVSNSELNNVDGIINRQQSTTGTLGATDADGDTVVFTAGTYTTANGGSVTVDANGAFSYQSPKKLRLTQDLYWHNAAIPNAPGDLVTVTVSDGFGAVVNIVYSIPIETLNENPSSSVSVDIDSTDALGVVRGTLTGSDPDNSNINYTINGSEDILSYGLAGAGNPAGATATSSATANGGIVQVNGNSFTYIPTQGVSSDSFNVLVSDGHGGTAVATVNLTSLTTPAPVANINTSTTNVVTGKLDVPAGDTGLGLTYSVGDQGAKGTVVVNSNGTFTYTRAANLGHSTTPDDSFTIQATDNLGRSVTIATVNVTPTVANSAPTVVTDTAPAVGSRSGTTQTTTGTIIWSDADGDALEINGLAAPVGSSTITLSSRNGGVVVLDGDGYFTYTRTVSNTQSHEAARIGAADNARNDYIDFTVTDDFGGTTVHTVQVPVYATNSAPTISGGSKLLGNVTLIDVDDADADDLSFSHNGLVFTFGGLGLPTSSLVGGSSLTVTDGYYTVDEGVVQATPASTTKTW